RQTLRHVMAVEYLAVQLQSARTTLAHARAVVFPVELERVLARRECLLALPLHPFQLYQVPGEDLLPLQQVKAITPEPAASATHPPSVTNVPSAPPCGIFTSAVMV